MLHPLFMDFYLWDRRTHLSYVLKVVVSLLQGSGSVEGLPHTRVFAEERLAVVLYPVHHLQEREHEDLLVTC